MDPSVLITTDYNDNSGFFFSPAIPFVSALSITISGASSGNGTFGLADFDTVLLWTNGVTLDFTKELIGQPTAVDPFGTPSSNGGDFNLFNRTQSTSLTAPDGVFFFQLGANAGTGDSMLLTSFRPAGAAVPEPTSIALLATSLGLTGIAVRRFRRKR
jgi:hypothetical protein